MTTLTITLPAPRHSTSARALGRRLALALGIALVRWSRVPVAETPTRSHAEQARALAALRDSERARAAHRYGFHQ